MPHDDKDSSPRHRRSVEETLEKLRQIAQGKVHPGPGESDAKWGTLPHLATLRLIVGAPRSLRVVAAASIAGTSAGVIAVLKILSAYFE